MTLDHLYDKENFIKVKMLIVKNILSIRKKLPKSFFTTNIKKIEVRKHEEIII